MNLSDKRRSELYRAIHDSIVDVRIKLKLSAGSDAILAQVEHEIWARVCKVLRILQEPVKRKPGVPSREEAYQIIKARSLELQGQKPTEAADNREREE